MPSRAFNATTAPQAEAGSRYMIHRDDTLWSIASSARPSGTSVHQTMLDIQRLNPDAFIDGNINKIKAGYIIYLPTESDISSADESRAMAEVRSQNQAWRDGKATEPDYGSGPSLRISAEPEEEAIAEPADAAVVATNAAALEDMEKSGLERVELEQRLASMEQQVETLQRIVSLKDDQIAALQNVLAEKQEDGEAGLPEAELVELEALEGEVEGTAEIESAESPEEVAVVESVAQVDDDAVAAAEAVAVAKAPAPEKPKPDAPAPTESSPGFFSNLWFVIGAVVLGLLGILYMRRRGQTEESVEVEQSPAPTPAEKVFADVKLTDQELELEEAPEPQKLEEEDVSEPAPDTRGYGEHKHDEYASDEGSDALAEAEIYIAYGRYPQAIELLRNALTVDPANAAYRLKLLQLYLETGDRPQAMEQFSELESIGDSDMIAQAKAALGSQERAVQADPVPPASEPQTETNLLAERDDALESDFSGLEIEEVGPTSNLEDELDLSTDFDETDIPADNLEEDLLIAAESNGMSTKLDLARAYMDMGDDDGARQILEEVAAEGHEELQAEARALIERIG